MEEIWRRNDDRVEGQGGKKVAGEREVILVWNWKFTRGSQACCEVVVYHIDFLP